MKSIIITLLMLSNLISTYAQQTPVKSENESTKAAMDLTESTGPNQGLAIRSISGIVPLYVVNDTAITAEQVKHISPNNIKSIRVLKDAKSFELYGEKGKNGVILISTKESVKIPQKR